MKAVLARRIARLNREFAVAKRAGQNTAPFIRRAKSLTAVWRGLEDA